mgnify:FL=1
MDEHAEPVAPFIPFASSLKIMDSPSIAAKRTFTLFGSLVLTTRSMLSRKEWDNASEELLEIQKVWKTIGFAPKRDNNRIYERFRSACDRFFELKREFYAGQKSEWEHNLAVKQELCEAAEALSLSEKSRSGIGC